MHVRWNHGSSELAVLFVALRIFFALLLFFGFWVEGGLMES